VWHIYEKSYSYEMPSSCYDGDAVFLCLHCVLKLDYAEMELKTYTFCWLLMMISWIRKDAYCDAKLRTSRDE